MLLFHKLFDNKNPDSKFAYTDIVIKIASTSNRKGMYLYYYYQDISLLFLFNYHKFTIKKVYFICKKFLAFT